MNYCGLKRVKEMTEKGNATQGFLLPWRLLGQLVKSENVCRLDNRFVLV